MAGSAFKIFNSWVPPIWVNAPGHGVFGHAGGQANLAAFLQGICDGHDLNGAEARVGFAPLDELSRCCGRRSRRGHCMCRGKDRTGRGDFPKNRHAPKITPRPAFAKGVACVSRNRAYA